MKDLIKEVAPFLIMKFWKRDQWNNEYFDGIGYSEALVAELSKRATAIAWTNEVELDYVKNIRPDGDEPSAAMWRVYHEDSPIPVFTFPPIHDIEIVGLKELLEEVQKADDALSAGDKNEALIKVRTAWVAASIVKQHIRNRKLFKPLDIEAIENRVAEACAKLADAQQEMQIKFIEGMGGESRPFVPKDTAEAIRNQEWRKHK